MEEGEKRREEDKDMGKVEKPMKKKRTHAPKGALQRREDKRDMGKVERSREKKEPMHLKGLCDIVHEYISLKMF